LVHQRRVPPCDPGQRDDALAKAYTHRAAPFASLITCIEAARTAPSGWWPGRPLARHIPAVAAGSAVKFP